mgnify:CR=1 FL=1
MKPGDLVRYSVDAPEVVQHHLGLVLEAKDWNHPATSNVLVQWLSHGNKTTWHHTLGLEVISESR